MTPETYLKHPGAPFRLVSKDGAVLRDIMTLKEAVEEIHPFATLPHVSLIWIQYVKLARARGFVGRAAEVLGHETTHSLVEL